MSTRLFSIGLTGGIGSGKTTVAQRFAEHGIPLIDTDQIAHALTSAGGAAMRWIEQTFGADFIDSNGALKRISMRHLIFNNVQARQRLQNFLHPLISAEAERLADAAQGPYLIFIVPLLTESEHWKKRVDRVLLVDCSPSTQIARVMQRSGLTRQEVLAIMAQQATPKQRRAYADDILLNEDATKLNALYEDIDKLHERYLNLAYTPS